MLSRAAAASLLIGVFLLVGSVEAKQAISVPLRAHKTNPNYFMDDEGRPVYLTGSHTWNNLQDWGNGNSVRPLDFTAYANMLVKHGHNFTLLWRTELPRFCGLPTGSGLDF